MSRETERINLRLEQAALRADQAELRAERARLRAEELERQVSELRERSLRALQLERFSLWRRLVDGAWWASVIASTYLPLRGVEPLARNFAGQNAQVEDSLRISIAFAVVVSIGWMVTGAQSRLRKRKIKAQRQRLEQLEHELKEATVVKSEGR